MRASGPVAFVAGMLIALTGAARAEQPGPQIGPYIGLGLGPNFLSDAPLRGGGVSSTTFDSGWTTIGSVGIALDRNWRAEADTGSGWTPYFGAGIGALRYRASGLRTSPDTANDGTTLAYQGVVGVSYSITPNSRFFLDYRYLRAEESPVRSSASSNARSEYHSSTVLMGLRFTLAQPESGTR